MAKNKSKERLLAEIAYAAGYRYARAVEGNADEEELNTGAASALAKWNEETGGRKHVPDNVERARAKWQAEGRPPEGTVFGAWPAAPGLEGFVGVSYVFKPNGDYDLTKSFEKNMGPGLCDSENADAAKAGK